MNAAAQIPYVIKPGVVQNLHSLGAARPHLADGDDIPVRIEFVQAIAQLGKRDQLPTDIGDFKLGFIADIEQKQILSRIQPPLQLFNAYHGNAHSITLAFSGERPCCRIRLK